MYIFHDFDFIDVDSKEDVDVLGWKVNRSDVDTVFNAINSVLKWSKGSIYRNCFKDVDIVLSDCPGEPIQYVDFHEGLDKLYIHLNILCFIDDFEKRPEFRKILFGKEWRKFTLYEYVQFFLLHEMGHIVHAQLGCPNEKKLVEKFDYVVKRYQMFHMNLDKKYENDPRFFQGNEVFVELETAYRKIPSEVFADTFAFRNLEELKNKQY